MQIITDYQIVTAQMTKTIQYFGEIIDALVKEGWQPLGTPFIILDSRWQQINQTMVKYTKEKSPLPSGSYLFGEGKDRTKVWDVEIKEWILLSEVMLMLNNNEQELIKWLSREES